MLSDPQKRAAYDQYGHAGVDPNMGGRGGAEGFGGFAEAFGDIFGDIFGSRAAGGRRRRPAGLPRQRPELRDGDHARGSGRTARKRRSASRPGTTCETCNGSGAKPGTRPITCTTCHGAGAVQMRQGFFSMQQTCPHCHGSGKIIPEPCTTCHGQGQIKKNKTLEVKIPAGIDDGMRIRCSGNGEPGTNGGPPGDLYIEIRLKKHDIFERDGDDLHCAVPVSMTSAALGGEIEVPTLGGKAAIDIPEGTQNGKTVPPARQGHQGRALQLPGRPVLPRQRRDAGQADRAPAQAAQGARRVACRKAGDRHSPDAKTWSDRVKDLFKA